MIIRLSITVVVGILFLLQGISKPVFAVTPTPILELPLPGTCGIAGSPDPNSVRCCKTPIMSPDEIKKILDSNTPTFLSAFVQGSGITANINSTLNKVQFLERQKTTNPCIQGSPSTPGDTNSNACICIAEPTPVALTSLLPVCGRIDSRFGEQSKCESCINKSGVWTALGCFEGNLGSFISNNVLSVGVGLAGGISLLCIIFAAFQMQNSGGNAEKIKKAQELLINCITGLMVVLFSVLILKIIGVDILRIPGFSSP